MLHVQDDRLTVRTKTLEAQLVRGALVSLTNLATGRAYLAPPPSGDPSPTPLQLIFRGHDTVDLTDRYWGRAACKLLSPIRAQFLIEVWDGLAVVTCIEDLDTGDLILEPSGMSHRAGLRSVRWRVGGIAPDLDLVAPFFQGTRLKLSDPLLHNFRWAWPQYWEAGLAILQGKDEGFSVQTRDPQGIYKALSIHPDQSLAFETEAYGPLDDNRAAGGLAWHINVHQGDWHTPAASYRDWLASLPAHRQRTHPDWVDQVKLAVSWCPSDVSILDALSKRVDPRKVILHLSHWRTDGYDQNYPTYTPNPEATAFIRKGASMGFRVMPHFNALEADPTHPLHAHLRDFLYESVENRQIQGWSWITGKGPVSPPEGPSARLANQHRCAMTKTHPGLAYWRHLLASAIHDVVADLDLTAVFIDVTLVTHNLHRCLVENQTSTQAMSRLIDEVAQLHHSLVVGGEGLNEATLGLSFAQAHLYKWGSPTLDELERTGPCDLNQFLLGRWCRTIGYSRLQGPPEEALRILAVNAAHGVLPTIIGRSANDIESRHPAVEKALELAGI
ncbi:MAG: hypothetical protein IT441_01890 [Phycisphaeraceae bacterium]|nr:hypothetical protein [Phycisphaeraceae bacterium]